MALYLTLAAGNSPVPAWARNARRNTKRISEFVLFESVSTGAPAFCRGSIREFGDDRVDGALTATRSHAAAVPADRHAAGISRSTLIRSARDMARARS